MNWWKKALAAGLLMVAIPAIAAGIYTNGLPLISATTQNGTTQSAPNGVVTQLPASGGPLVPVDTNLSGGAAPQTVAASPFQIAATFVEAYGNSATSTAAAATLNTTAGVITTESLSTAAGSTYTFVLTNSLITASGSVPYVAMYSKTNTGGRPVVTSITNSSGSTSIVFTNAGTTAFNGTMLIVFHL